MFRPIALFAFIVLALGLLTTAPQAQTVPRFAVDPAWPKPLPNNWLLGQVGGIFVDDQDHIWVNQRPRSLTDDERGTALVPPLSISARSTMPSGYRSSATSAAGCD